MYNYFYFCACQESALDIKLGVDEIAEEGTGLDAPGFQKASPRWAFSWKGGRGSLEEPPVSGLLHLGTV